MAKILMAPNKYVQSKGVMKEISNYVKILGSNALCLISQSGTKRIKPAIDESYSGTNQSITYDIFNGECCESEINRLIEVCKEKKIDVVIGVGGGKIHDTAKAVAYYSDLPVVIVPTIASTDAPCSALSVIYTEEGEFSSYLFLKQNPNIVLVDTEVIAKAPARLLVAGMGDALATYFEARACANTEATTCANGTSTMAAMALAKLCYETLLEKGELAKIAVEQHVCTKAVDKIIEANTLLSGIGFESGGLAGCHAIHNGFTVLPATHHMYHGEKVAYGTLVQLVLEDGDEGDLEDVLMFCKDVGLPVTLAELGIKEIVPEDIMAVAKAATVETESIHNMPFKVTAEDVYDAILAVDALGREIS